MSEASPGGSILIVEDDPDIRLSLRFLLEDEGYEVHEAENGLEALRVLRQIPPPCLVLLDLFMPVMNGVDFLREIGTERPPSLVSVPVIIITAGAPGSEEVRTARQLAQGFVKKPLDLEALTRVVAEHCRRTPLRKAS